jgi:response regulator of citrate/malate metabolism
MRGRPPISKEAQDEIRKKADTDSINHLAKSLNVSKNTVKKYLQAGVDAVTTLGYF